VHATRPLPPDLLPMGERGWITFQGSKPKLQQLFRSKILSMKLTMKLWLLLSLGTCRVVEGHVQMIYEPVSARASGHSLPFILHQPYDEHIDLLKCKVTTPHYRRLDAPPPLIS
jgi:hypothetical protein